jgi:FMN phosphatase YigB (HAD superfamily)
MGLEPAETMFVAGSPYDAEGARAAGLRAAFVRRRREQRAPDGVMTLASLTEVVTTLVG